jgi:hypothetical protein
MNVMWTNATTFPPPVTNLNSLTSFCLPDDRPRVYYIGPNEQIWELAYEDGAWKGSNILLNLNSNIQGVYTPLDGGLLAGFTQQVQPVLCYFNRQQRVYLLAYLTSYHNWNGWNMVASPPIAGSALTVVPSTGSPGFWVYYCDSNWHICQVVNTGSDPLNLDITNEAKAAPVMPGSMLTSCLRPNKGRRVYYNDANWHIWQLASNSATTSDWKALDIMAMGTTSVLSPALPGSLLCSTAGLTDNINLYYISSDRNIYLLTSPTGDAQSWAYVNITKDLKVPPSLGSTLASATLPSGETRAYYIAAGWQIYELAFTSTGWRATNITSAASALDALAGSAITAFGHPDGQPRVYYVAANQHVCELTSDSGSPPKWKVHDLTSETKAPVFGD